jgi:hypothetical protein
MLWGYCAAKAVKTAVLPLPRGRHHTATRVLDGAGPWN